MLLLFGAAADMLHDVIRNDNVKNSIWKGKTTPRTSVNV